MRRLLGAALVITLAVAMLRAQQPPPPPPAPEAGAATVSYAVDSANRDPARFSLAIDLVGHATYVAQDGPAHVNGDAPAHPPGSASTPSATAAAADTVAAPPYRSEFDISPATRDRVFALAQVLDYFHGDFEFRKHAVADTGRKTFTYRDGMRQSATVFHWSENKQIQELTNLFESIALTQNFARRLAYLRRYDKLGLDSILKRMEELAHANYLGEMQAIAPALRQIAADPNVMHVARERAQRLLDQSGAEPSK